MQTRKHNSELNIRTSLSKFAIRTICRRDCTQQILLLTLTRCLQSNGLKIASISHLVSGHIYYCMKCVVWGSRPFTISANSPHWRVKNEIPSFFAQTVSYRITYVRCWSHNDVDEQSQIVWKLIRFNYDYHWQPKMNSLGKYSSQWLSDYRDDVHLTTYCLFFTHWNSNEFKIKISHQYDKLLTILIDKLMTDCTDW